MKTIRSIKILQEKARRFKRRAKSIGFVPTMGFLHEGHLSLVRKARAENDIVIVSIFVNPKQFGPQEDYAQYPRDLKRDRKALKGLCDLLFVPPAAQMYPKAFATQVEVKGLSEKYCGRSRPGHFAGVATVVAKLLNITRCDNVYFGRKDAQQAAIIARLAEDLNFPVKVRTLPIVRERDGLAASSRNIYLSESERRDALCLYQSLKSAQQLVKSGVKEAGRIREALEDFIRRTSSARIDYIAIVDKRTFEPVRVLKKDALLLMAVFLGSTRLIDNAVLRVGRP